MDIQIEETGNVTVVRLSGILAGDAKALLEEQVNPLFQQNVICCSTFRLRTSPRRRTAIAAGTLSPEPNKKRRTNFVRIFA